MILRYLCLTLGLVFYIYAQAEAQTCRSETAIPSATPTRRFLVHGDGTVTDTATGLMWARCAEGLSGSDCADGAATAFTWIEALTRARLSTHARYTDWRLPNVKELTSIVEERCSNPAINLAVFPNVSSSALFWSASPDVSYQEDPPRSYTWFVESSDGDAYQDLRNSSNNMRLVRSGQ